MDGEGQAPEVQMLALVCWCWWVAGTDAVMAERLSDVAAEELRIAAGRMSGPAVGSKRRRANKHRLTRSLDERKGGAPQALHRGAATGPRQAREPRA